MAVVAGAATVVAEVGVATVVAEVGVAAVGVAVATPLVLGERAMLVREVVRDP
jgi:hypothetical protein